MAQLHELLDVKNNGSFIFKDSLLVDHRQQNLADVLNEIARQQNKLESMVRRYLQNDERLIGQEKANIVNGLHLLARNLTTLHLKIYDPENAGAFSTSVSVSEGKDGILVYGQMDIVVLRAEFAIGPWVNNYLEKATEGLVAAFQSAAKDRSVTLEEKVRLIEKVNDLLLQSLQSLHVMRTGAIFS